MDELMEENGESSNMSKMSELLEEITNHPLTYQSQVVILLGNTGSGKSTLMHLVYGETNKLKSVETFPDSGEFIIDDENNKIGHGILSRTFLADCINDPRNDIAIYDCPGFEDTRNVHYDLAGNYMMKNVVTKAKLAKFLFVINYSSLRSGVDRFDFIKLLHHATEFISNIYNYEESIALIVSKVDNEYKKQPHGLQLISDEIVKNKIAQFINDVKGPLNDTFANYSADFYKKALFLIDIFLKKNQGNLVNIVLFRRPDTAGNLTDLPVIQRSKNEILNVVHNLNFSLVDNDDFAFTISESSKNSLYLMIEAINGVMSKIISRLNHHFINSLTLHMDKFQNEYELIEEIRKLLLDLNNNIIRLKLSSDIKHFLVNFLTFLKIFDIDHLKTKIYKMKNCCSYINFLYEISNKQIVKLQISQWIKPLKTSLNFLQQCLNRSDFFINIYKKISTFKFYQKCQTIKHLGIISESNFEDLSRIFEIQIDFEFLPTIYVEKLNCLLQTCLQTPQVIADAETKTLEIKGEFFCTSAFTHHLSKYPNTQRIYVFARNTIFIDEDIIKIGEGLIIVMIAPTWEIIGDRMINLDGYKGQNHRHAKAKLDTNGIPGLPGGPGGSFYGIVQNYAGEGHLKISANGGKGGKGQDGGDGSPGQEETDSQELLSSSQNISIESPLDALNLLRFVVPYSTSKTFVTKKEGSRGNDGACAGAGGLGGCEGNVKIFGQQSHTRIFISSQKGEEGQPGYGGEGGEGGQIIHETQVTKEKEIYVFGVFKVPLDSLSLYGTETGTSSVSDENISYAPSGKTCTDITSFGQKAPKKSTKSDITKIICEYKLFTINNLNENLQTNKLKSFYDLFNSEKDIRILYKPNAFMKELYCLEMYTFNYGETNGLIDFYKSLLAGIENYMSENKTIFIQYIHAATFCRIVLMENKIHNNLIVNTEKYFDSLMQQSTNLEKNEKEHLILGFYNSYKENFNNNLNDATSFINEIIYKINSDLIHLQEHVTLLQNESNMLEKSSTKLKEKIMHDKKSVEKLSYEKNKCDFIDFLKLTMENLMELGTNIATEGLDTALNIFCPVNRIGKYILLINVGLNIVSKALDISGRNNNAKCVAYDTTKHVNGDEQTYKALLRENERNLKINLEKIKQNENNLLSFRECGTYICEILVPLYADMFEQLKEIKENPGNCYINIVTKWNIQASLKHLRSLIVRLKLDKDSQYLINIFEDGIDSLVSIYDQIHNYNEHHKMTKYITDLYSTNSYNVSDDPTSLAELDLIIKSNLIYQQYKNALACFKQHVFPFASCFLKELDVPYYNLEEKCIEQWVTIINDKIRFLQSKITEKKWVVDKNIDKHIHETKFFYKNNVGSFYVWDKYKNGESISQLLSGEKIILTPDVTNPTHEYKNAIKFKFVNIKFISTDENINFKLQNVLSNFNVILTHHGNSHYRYDNHFYKITSDSVVFIYSYQVDDNGEPIMKNDVYTKIKNGNFLLSPYATWSAQLECNSHVGFEHLEEFKWKVELQLVGDGQYISDNNILSSYDVQKYYQPLDITVADLLQISM